MSSPTRLFPLLVVLLLAPGGEALAQGRFGVRTAPPSSTSHPVVPGPGSGGTGHGWVPRGAPVVRPVPPPYVYGWGFGYRGWLYDPWWPEPVPVGPPTIVAPYGTYVAPGYPPGVYPPPSAFETWFVSTVLDDEAFVRIADALPGAARAAAEATKPA